jgi:hypothetical protein
MVLKCDERSFELLLTVNHYKYVLKFCNIKHGAPLPQHLAFARKRRGKMLGQALGVNRRQKKDYIRINIF